MKYCIILLSFLSVLNLYAQEKPKIKLLDTELHSDYYQETYYKKAVFKDFITVDSIFLKLPDSVRSFNFSPQNSLKNFQNNCEIKVKQLEQSFKQQTIEKNFNTYIKNKLSTCYAKYVQTAPEIRFAFENQQLNTVYHIKEVSVYIYSTPIALSPEKHYFPHKKDEREKLLIDLSKVGVNQDIELNQAHSLKDGGLALNLRLFPSEHWNGDFNKTKTLLHIDFKFTSGQTIQSEPLLIDF